MWRSPALAALLLLTVLVPLAACGGHGVAPAQPATRAATAAPGAAATPPSSPMRTETPTTGSSPATPSRATAPAAQATPVARATPTLTPQPRPQIAACGIPDARVMYCTPEPPDGSVACPTARIAFTLYLGIGPRSTPPPPTPSAHEGIGTVTLDRVDVTAQGRTAMAPSDPPAAYLWEYRPLSPLTSGRHEVVVAFGDAAGVTRSYRWAFEVQPIVCSG